VDAYNAHQLDQFLSFYTHDAAIVRLREEVVVARGISEIRTFYKRLFDNSPALKCEIAQRMVFGDCVIDKEQITGHFTKGDFTATAVYEVVGNLIRKVWFI